MPEVIVYPYQADTSYLKLKIKVPDYFDAKITTKKLQLCEVQMGSFTDRTKCIKDVPSTFEINENQTNINIFPNRPIPVNKKTYAVVMKIFNPKDL